MDSYGLQFNMSGFTNEGVGNSPPPSVMTSSSVASFEARMGNMVFAKVGIFNASKRLEVELLRLDESGMSVDDKLLNLQHFERVYPDDCGLLSKINDEVSKRIRTVYTRSKNYHSYCTALAKELKNAPNTHFDELPYEDAKTCNWLDNYPRLSVVAPFQPIVMSLSMFSELKFKGLSPRKVDSSKFTGVQAKDSNWDEIFNFKSCTLEFVVHLSMSCVDITYQSISNMSDRVGRRVKMSTGTINFQNVMLSLASDDILAKCGVVFKMNRMNSNCFYVAHMSSFEDCVDYLQHYDEPFLIAYTEKAQLDYACGSLMVRT